MQDDHLGQRQTRLTQFDDQILSLYAKGMSTRDIVAVFEVPENPGQLLKKV